MMKTVLRTIGIGCILAGGIVYFTNDLNEVVGNSEVQQLQDEVNGLKSELANTKKELAIAQTSSSTEKNVPKKDEKANEPAAKPSLIIESGSNSTIVAKSLENLGVIQDAAAFDTYLADNELSGKIQIGEYQLDASMDFQAIAQIITKDK